MLGIITARGGSKGIPLKNIAPLFGKPLLTYTAEAAFQSKRLNRIILSTDSSEIADVGLSLGLKVPFVRPPELSTDNTKTLPVLQDIVRKLEVSGDIYDAVFTLQPTSPLRLASDIDGAIELMERELPDSVIGYSPVGPHNPYRLRQIDSKGTVLDTLNFDNQRGQPRQSLPQFYERNGAVYLTRKNILMNSDSIYGMNSKAWIIPRERSVDIDDSLDLEYAEFLIRRIN